MSIFQNSSIGNFTRGGQTTMHFLRMIGQVMRKFMTLAIVTFVLTAGCVFWASTDSYGRYLTWKWAQGQVVVKGLKRTEGTLLLRLADGRDTQVRVTALIANTGVRAAVNDTYQGVVYALVGGVLGVLTVLGLAVKFIYGFGSGQAKDEHVRGGMLVDAKALAKLVKKRGRVSEITLAGTPMPKGADVAHTLIAGSPGTGKSTIFKEMLSGVRRRHNRAIVYDTAGEFVSHFYREGKDILLNALDERCVRWDIWSECARDYEYDRMAESLIPERGTGDPYWVMGARIVFSALAKKVAQEPNPSNERLMQAILNVSIGEITEYVKNTEAAAIISHGGERMAISVRGVLATYSRSLKYLPVAGPRFSIKEWVAADNDDNWVFITSKPDQKAALRPLVTAWLDTSSAAIMSLPPSQTRRIWLFIDELPSLNRLPSLAETLAGSRKHGECTVLGIQSFPQLIDIYNKNGADTIAGACSTWVVFRCNDSVGAKWTSEGMGNSEMVETFEGISFGASEIRDGVTLSKQRNLRPIVLPTEITNLEDLHGFIKFGRQFPIGRFVAKYRSYPEIVPAFEDRGIEDFSEAEGFHDPLVTGYHPPLEPQLRSAKARNRHDHHTARPEAQSQQQLDLEDDKYGGGLL